MQLATNPQKNEFAIPARLFVTQVEMGGVEQTSRLTGTDTSSYEDKGKEMRETFNTHTNKSLDAERRTRYASKQIN